MKNKYELTLEDIKEFIRKYYRIKGEVPRAREWKEKDGFPCSREWLHKKFLNKNYTYNDLIEDCGFQKRVPFNAKNGKLKKEDIIKFLKDYYKKYNVTPNLSQWKEEDGFPCNKEYLTKYYRYNDLLAEAGLPTYEYGQRHYNKVEILEDLRKAIVESRCFNITVLHKEFDYIKHRDIYAYIFGNFENALLAAGIENRHKILINRFNDYKLEDPVCFLRKKFGENGVFTKEQLKLIISIKNAAKSGDLRRKTMGKKISLHSCKKLFETYTIALIAAGLNPAKRLKAKMIAEDGDNCDSYGEMLVDNMLNNLNIKHSIHKRYPKSRYVCDFYIEDNIYIEYIEFSNVKNSYIRGSYLERLEKKKKIIKDIGAKLIIIKTIDEDTINIFKDVVHNLSKYKENIINLEEIKEEKKELKTAFYMEWNKIKQRCNDNSSIDYDESWMIYDNFYNNMYESYLNHLLIYGNKDVELDRLDLNKNYNKYNCRWV